MDQVPIKRALVSVSDKTGIVDFCKTLANFGVELLSTGGTARALREAGLAVKDVSEHTGFPEMMDGRVKTLHPKVHGGLLALRDHSEHMAKAREFGIGLIDMVVVNLYPFEFTAAKPGVAREEAIEQIDIGGPSMVRSAAKNHAFVAVVTAPEQYAMLARELGENRGALSLAARRRLAVAAFETTALYDGAIAAWMARQEARHPATPDAEGERERESFPKQLFRRYTLRQPLRYGENPHQTAAVYRDPDWWGAGLAGAEQLSGKELSYNNYLDIDSALRLVFEFSEAAAVVVKHNTPCGCSVAKTTREAFERAYDGDPLSAFGGIVALNRACDADTAAAMIKGNTFLEAVVAPEFDPEALALITERNPKKWAKSIRLLALHGGEIDCDRPDLRAISGGVLAQSPDFGRVSEADLKTPTRVQPDEDTLRELLFAWRIVKYVKSNAICLTRAGQLIGAGGGQTSRVDAAEIALRKAGEKARGAALASDAFFPFPDSVELAAKAGVRAIIQPGGSVKDADVIAACDAAGIVMVLTGMRHFRH